MTQETARETAETVTEALEQAEDRAGVEPLREVADGDRDPSELGWEDWTYPLKVVETVILQVEIHGHPVKWFDVRKGDLLHVHCGGSCGGWRQVLPGNLRSSINRASSGGGYDVMLRPVLRGETPTTGGGGDE